MCRILTLYMLVGCGLLAANTPNILVILTDEETRIPYGWEEVLEPWYEEALPGHGALKECGVEFTHHLPGATACTPSRAVLYTGQYPTVTGIDQTYGIAKDHDDPRLTWLEEYSVPTLGNWMLAAGYQEENVAYIGKFHLADMDLRDERGRILQTKDSKGVDIAENMALYRERHPLRPYGFSNVWIGPDPHGAAFENSGTVRDPDYVQQAIDFIEAKTRDFEDGSAEPFVCAVNLVNPHDVVLAFALWLLGNYPDMDDIPDIPICPETDYLDLETQPSVHQEYKDVYKRFYAWDWLVTQMYDDDSGRDQVVKFYYYLLKEVDKGIVRILEALKASPFFDNTYVIFTSDHGDLLGRRGRQWQKWHSLNREVTDLPFYISHPKLARRQVDMFTSHADLLPTIFGLTGIDVEDAQEALEESFGRVGRPKGMDLSSVIHGGEEDLSRAVYSMTQDEISKGDNPFSRLAYEYLPRWACAWVPGVTFEPLEGAVYLESVRAYHDGNEWNLIHYWDPTREVPSEWALYNISEDGFEVHNIIEEDPDGFFEVFQVLWPKLVERRNYYASELFLGAA